jgi:hypothetical protein
VVEVDEVVDATDAVCWRSKDSSLESRFTCQQVHAVRTLQRYSEKVDTYHRFLLSLNQGVQIGWRKGLWMSQRSLTILSLMLLLGYVQPSSYVTLLLHHLFLPLTLSFLHMLSEGEGWRRCAFPAMVVER